MNYYFKIADIVIKIASPFIIHWNKYITNFLCDETNYDEYYELKLVKEINPQGSIVYSDSTQIILKTNYCEERLHYFYGQNIPCMLYKEGDDKKVIYLNEYYINSFKRDENYCIFNALAFEKVLIKHEAIILHCSYILIDDFAILFSAPSGTGKSTQANLWYKYRDAQIINGDRAIIKKIGNRYYAMGTPICGSSDISKNISKPLKAIIYLSQSKNNYIEKIEQKEMIKKLISETTINFFNQDYFNKAFDIINHISTSVEMYHLWCTKDINAIKCLEKVLKGDKL